VQEVVQRLLDAHEDAHDESLDGAVPARKLYADPQQRATDTPAKIPKGLTSFALGAVAQALVAQGSISRALGELLSEPKPHVWFDAPAADAPVAPRARERVKQGASSAIESHAPVQTGVLLDARSRMLYDEHNLFLNGESFSVSGRDATLLRRLADQRQLQARDVQRLSPQALQELAQWWAAGWVRSIRSEST
jgi:50S ribosomal protein L16 3-hydroxylase